MPTAVIPLSVDIFVARKAKRRLSEQLRFKPRWRLTVRIHIHCLDQPLIESSSTSARGPTVVAVTGDLDTPAVPDFLEGIDRAVSEAARTLIVDLSRVDFVSISAVQALAEAQDRATCMGLAMLLVPAGPVCVRALWATGMANHFDCFRSVRSAVTARRAELAAHTHLGEVRTITGTR
ncbi:hypothetical protein GCM10023094_39950 [Rhodococcus olei]|uniref:STAS domain-containing protein n=2 Tax=Rhodococcus olei TaxID=2161675 RepID=A0ABP8PCD6_9NOCA